MNYCRAVLQEQRKEPQGERHGGQPLDDVVEMHLRQHGAVVPYAGLLELLDEHARVRRVRPYQLDDVILVAFRARPCYVHRHALRSAYVEMRYYVEYFFHPLLSAKLAIISLTDNPCAPIIACFNNGGRPAVSAPVAAGCTKGRIWACERRLFTRQKAAFRNVKGRLS